MTDNTATLGRMAALPRWDARAMGWPRPRPLLIIVALTIGALFPLIAPDRSWLSVATLAMITLTLAQSWNLVLGYGGVWNFGQLAFYALGAYSAALITIYLPVPAWLSLIIAGCVSGGIALLLSIPVLRLRGIYVSLLTFGFAEVVRLLIVADQSGITGGSYGLSGFGGFGFTGPGALSLNYWVAFVAAVATTLIVLVLVRSPLGNGMIAMRDNPALASARGIGQKTYQMLVFAISGFLAGVAGALYANVFTVASPTLMGLSPMTLVVTMLVVGGMGTVAGPIVGTLLLSFVQMQLQDLPEVRLAALGVVLLVVILTMPRGLVPFFSGLWAKLEAWMAEDDEDDERDEGDESHQDVAGAVAAAGPGGEQRA
ncbi:branched-chain amino acid ABC transporter permease [Leucobacter luti]|uniref:Amino acid/amide ABC transporter membrane protein 2 (HAAT family) n=1 Tax=Leucobacter luti TaxID=340320 RepID=A0A4Q7U4L7_9MICO|nr:branched-chain amino acid ABC transporter permease [Leucobacter luti]MBL3700560.1 branched-chain amino acid ABC transporter permease [Leucobacter luti]RZT68604.1 amino acid/amide ABC transporter membrane protein 2 (HAAT family) [Leucobacter luti]